MRDNKAASEGVSGVPFHQVPARGHAQRRYGFGGGGLNLKEARKGVTKNKESFREGGARQDGK